MLQIDRPQHQPGAIIQSHRLGRGLTQTELANLSDTQQKTISAIENDSEDTKLNALLGVIAILGLDLQIVPRQKGSKSIVNIF